MRVASFLNCSSEEQGYFKVSARVKKQRTARRMKLNLTRLTRDLRLLVLKKWKTVASDWGQLSMLVPRERSDAA